MTGMLTERDQSVGADRAEHSHGGRRRRDRDATSLSSLPPPPRPRDHHQPGRRAQRCGARHGALILNERGLTLVEILVAAFIIGIGLVGLMSVVPISSYGLHEGNSLTRATFLAEQKMEEIRNAVWLQSSGIDCVGLSAGNGDVAPTSTTCTRQNPTACASGGACPIAADEASVAGNTGYTRTLRIVDCATVAGGCGTVIDANFRRVTVTVTYQPLSGSGATPAGSTKPVVLTTNIGRR